MRVGARGRPDWQHRWGKWLWASSAHGAAQSLAAELLSVPVPGLGAMLVSAIRPLPQFHFLSSALAKMPYFSLSPRPLCPHPPGLTVGWPLGSAGGGPGLRSLAGTLWGSVLGALGDGAGGPASPAVESGEDYVNVAESEESADVSLGEWPLPTGVPLPCLTLLWHSSGVSCSLTLHVAVPPSALPPADGSREYVNVSQELPPMARTEAGVCWAGGGAGRGRGGGWAAAEARGARLGKGGPSVSRRPPSLPSQPS